MINFTQKLVKKEKFNLQFFNLKNIFSHFKVGDDNGDGVSDDHRLCDSEVSGDHSEKGSGDGDGDGNRNGQANAHGNAKGNCTQ